MEMELLRLVEEGAKNGLEACAVCRGIDPVSYQSRYYVLIKKDTAPEKFDKHLNIIDSWRKQLNKRVEISLRTQRADFKDAKNYGVCIWPSGPMYNGNL